jgi:holliday junction DNA helicase RuvA
MISSLKGTITACHDMTITIELSSGIAFDVATPYTHQYSINSQAHIITYFHWHQELGPNLYGFNTHADRIFFILLISAPGIGPKMALSLLAQLSTSDLAHAISTQDITQLSSLNGIGTKKAEQLISHIRHKVIKLLESGAITTSIGHSQHYKTIAETLTSLNYSRTEIADALAFVQAQANGNDSTFEKSLRQALSFLSHAR